MHNFPDDFPTVSVSVIKIPYKIEVLPRKNVLMQCFYTMAGFHQLDFFLHHALLNRNCKVILFFSLRKYKDKIILNTCIFPEAKKQNNVSISI